MIDLGSTDFVISGASLPRKDFESYTTRLFDDWEIRLAKELALPDYSLTLEVEEGSVVGVATVATGLGALYIGIGNYGSFVSGLETIRKQLRSAGDYLTERAAAPFTMLDLKPRVSRRSGALGQLQRLFLKVERRDLTVDEAMREAEHLLGPDASTSPEFMERLSASLSSVRRHLEQLLFPMDLPDGTSPNVDKASEPGTRLTRGKLAVPPLQQLRVEVWKETRTGKRQIRITEL